MVGCQKRRRGSLAAEKGVSPEDSARRAALEDDCRVRHGALDQRVGREDAGQALAAVEGAAVLVAVDGVSWR